jgi:threonine dehydratase
MEPRTPLEKTAGPARSGRAVFLKREDRHPLGAFKWRGALPAVEAFRARGAAGIVTASTGNHGSATAWAARQCGLPATVYAPLAASRAKLALIEGFGALVRLTGRDLDEAKQAARDDARDNGLAFFEDGAEPAQYEGYGSIAEEILEQCEERPVAIVVPVGNGALIGGIGQAIRRRGLATLVIGVAAKEAPVMALSFEAGRPVPCDRMATFADGLAVRVAIPHAVAVMRLVVDRMLLVSEREIAGALGAAAASGLRVEGAAGAALAALRQIEDIPGPIVIVVTGRNIDEELYRRAVEDPGSFSD